MGIKLGSEVGEGHRIWLGTLVSMETKKGVTEKKKTVSLLTCRPDDHEGGVHIMGEICPIDEGLIQILPT